MKKRLLCILAALLLCVFPARANEPAAAVLHSDEMYAEKAEQFGLADLYDGAPDAVQDQLDGRT